MTQEPDQQLSVDLYVRADAPIVGRRDAVIDRLKRLERTDRIVEFRIHPWPHAISLTLVKEIEAGGIKEVVRSFETWADQHDHHITPSFDVRASHSAITGESDERLALPLMCLAAYTDGDLVGVVPASDGESVRTVEDALDAIEAGNAPIPEGASASGEQTHRESTERTKQRTLRLAAEPSNSTGSDE